MPIPDVKIFAVHLFTGDNERKGMGSVSGAESCKIMFLAGDGPLPSH